MSIVPTVELRVYPDDCDARGHVNQAAFARMFERARWEVLARGPGFDVFERHAIWPVVRKSTVEYYAEVLSGQVVQFDAALTQMGRSSFSLHQTARRPADRAIVCEGDFVLVCVDARGTPVPVPDEIRRYFGTRPSIRAGSFQHVVVRGVAMAIDVQGDGSPILMIHGFPLDRTMWRRVAAQLTGWRRIAPDLRGLGMSDATAGSQTMTTYADDMAAVLDHLGIDRAVVCGLSMGSYVALEMIRRHRDRVRALILIATRATADSVEGKAARNEMAQVVEAQGSSALVDRMLPKLLSPATRSTAPQIVAHLRTMIESSNPLGVLGALLAMRDREDPGEILATIDVPTLVVAGREDALIPVAEARAVADAIPGAQLTLIPEAGHLVPMEQPVATGRVMAEFLQLLA